MTKGFINGRIEQTTDFDYDAVEERLNPPAADASELVAASRLLHHIRIIGATNPRETIIWIDVFLFVTGLHPNQNYAGEKISAGLKLSKEEFFRRVSRMRRILSARGLHLPRIAGQWGSDGKKSVANSAIRSWQKRGGQPILKISEAEKKLIWIADYVEKLNFKELTPSARQELRAKLLPVLELFKQL